MPIIELPDGREVEFPDGMDNAAIATAIKSNFPEFSAKPAKPAAPAKPARERTWGEALTDTASQLGEGVHNIVGAIPNLVAPESAAAKYFNDGSKAWRDAQSEPIKQRTAEVDAKISAAGEEGVIAQVVEAARQYSSDPALAARFVTTNLPSMIPGIGAAKLAQASALARGATAAKAAAVATTAAGATNAALNAGGARGEAFEDIKSTLIKQGMSPLEAEQKAIADSRLPAAIGGVTGFISGKTGLEGAIAGQASRTAGSAARRAIGSSVSELAGEQLEEVAPKLATNYQAGQYDGRAITKDVGRTMVETAIGSGPGAAVGAWAAARNPQAAADPAPAPVPIPAPAARIEPTLSDIGNAETVDDAIRAAADLISTPSAARADLPTGADIDALEDAYANQPDADGLPELPGLGRDDGLAAEAAPGPVEAVGNDGAAGVGAAADPALPGPADGIAVPGADGAADAQPALSDAGIPMSAAPADDSADWRAFPESTGTLNIPRAEMPQIKAEHRGAMTRFMNARGVTHEQIDIDAAELKPTQAEFSMSKVQQAKDYQGGNRSILVSSDGHVLDGHHQWLAAVEDGQPVKAIRLNSPIRELVGLAHEFPSSTISQEGNADVSESPQVPEEAAPASREESAPQGRGETGVGSAPGTEPAAAPVSKLEQRRALNDKQDAIVRKAQEAYDQRKAAKAKPAPQPVPIIKEKGGRAVDVEKTAAALPPVEDGHVRLYRAESPTVKFSDVFDADGLADFKTDKPGQRYTPDLKYADYYRLSYGNDAAIHYVDVPSEVAAQGKLDDAEYAIETSAPAEEVKQEESEVAAKPEAEPAQAAPSPEPEPSPAPSKPEAESETESDIPAAFYSRVDVQIDVWDKAESRYEPTTMPADQALDAVRSDIDTYRAMIACMKS